MADETATLARWVATARVPEATRRVTRRYLLDWLGSALGGGDLRSPTMVRDVVRDPEDRLAAFQRDQPRITVVDRQPGPAVQVDTAAVGERHASANPGGCLDDPCRRL